MTVSIQYVPTEYAAQTWPFVEHHIKRMEGFEPCDHTLDQMRMQVCTGGWTLLVAVDESNQITGAATVAFQSYPNDRIAFITSMGGRGITGRNSFKQLQELLRAKGATRIQGYARESMARFAKAYGLKEVAVLLDAPL